MTTKGACIKAGCSRGMAGGALERAVNELLPNDVDEQVRDTVSKGWSKDQWISGVMERALGVVARSAEKGEQEFKLTPLAEDAVRFSVQDDRNVSSFYKEHDGFQQKHLATYFPIRNIDVEVDGGNAIHMQGTQRPDSISLLKLSGADKERKVCICFEGDGHNLDQGKSKSGMFMHEKMFQGASLCHDVNPDVPAVFVTSALWKHDREKFQTFSAWSEAFLKAHVVLVEQVLQYINNRKTSSIERRLQEMQASKPDTRVFDLFCWINAKRVDARATVESDVEHSYAQMIGDSKRDAQIHGDDFAKVLAWRLKFEEHAFATQLSDETRKAADGLLRQSFSANVINMSSGSIPVVIFAVPRVDMADIGRLAADKKHACPGMWYPMHVAAYRSALQENGGRSMDNFLTATALPQDAFETPLSDLPYSDASRLIPEVDWKHMNGIRGHVVFAMPWLWLNIGFLCKLKTSMTYTVAKNSANTLQMYVNFTRKHATQVNSRDTVKNPMQMFKSDCTSLFAYVCKQRDREVDLDQDLESFFEDKCGWRSPSNASSPAVFFKMIGASNLITAHTLARQIKCKAALGERLEQTKAIFPLAAQVEIDYALECLCRHYYYAQDKTNEGFVRKEDFDNMRRKLLQELREAKAEAAEQDAAEQDEAGQDAAEQDEAEQDADETNAKTPAEDLNKFPGKRQHLKGKKWTKYAAPDGYQLVDKLEANEFNIKFLRNRIMVILYTTTKGGKEWYPCAIRSQDLNVMNDFKVEYKQVDGGDLLTEKLEFAEYNNLWVLLEKKT